MRNKFIALIGERNSGKTTQLLSVFNREYAKGKRILVIDSATEHPEKSLLNKLRNVTDALIIEACDENEIVFPGGNAESNYPYSPEILKHRVYLADVSRYLEDGYNYPEGEQRENRRLLYKKLSMQIIEALSDHIDLLLMDEIELIPESMRVFKLLKKRKITVYIALHKDSGLSAADELFRIERI